MDSVNQIVIVCDFFIVISNNIYTYVNFRALQSLSSSYVEGFSAFSPYLWPLATALLPVLIKSSSIWSDGSDRQSIGRQAWYMTPLHPLHSQCLVKYWRKTCILKMHFYPLPERLDRIWNNFCETFCLRY